MISESPDRRKTMDNTGAVVVKIKCQSKKVNLADLVAKVVTKKNLANYDIRQIGFTKEDM